MSVKALGWDVHRKFSQVSVQRRDDDGEIRVIERKRLEHFDREAMRSWLARFEAGTPVAMEGAFGWQWIADLLAEVGLDPHLGHPPAIKVLAKSEAKGDRCDADRLGRFYLRGIFPESYLATVEVRCEPASKTAFKPCCTAWACCTTTAIYSASEAEPGCGSCDCRRLREPCSTASCA